jgi:hypothetical protein
MASQGDRPPPADGIDFTTLLLSAIASASAAYITSKIWGPGTLFSAAFAPVIVALVKEGLRRPTEKVANVVPSVMPAPARWSRTSASEPGLVAQPEPTAEPGVHRDPDAPHVDLPPVVPAQNAPVRVYSTRARRLRWRLAVITGLLGFGIAVVVFTVPELIAGGSLGGSHKTTIFGGRHHKSTNKTDTTTSTSTTGTTTATTPAPTQTTATVTRTETVTTPAPATTPAATTPTTATPAPQQGTASSTTPAAP